MEWIAEFIRCRWLHKAAKMSSDRNSRKFLAAWCGKAKMSGGQQQTIGKGCKNALKTLGHYNDEL